MCVKCRVTNDTRIPDAEGRPRSKTYYAVFPLSAFTKPGELKKLVEVYTEEEWKKCEQMVKRVGSNPKRALSGISDIRKDAEAVDRYVDHQALDRILAYAHEHGLAAAPAGNKFNYGETIVDITNTLNLDINTPRGAPLSGKKLTPIKDRKFFVVKANDEINARLKETPARIVDTNAKVHEMPYKAVSSNNAVYVFVNETEFNFLTNASPEVPGEDAFMAEVNHDLTRLLVHEIGVMTGMDVKNVTASNVPINALDERYAEWVASGAVKPETKWNITVVDLDRNILSRDYAASVGTADSAKPVQVAPISDTVKMELVAKLAEEISKNKLELLLSLFDDPNEFVKQELLTRLTPARKTKSDVYSLWMSELRHFSAIVDQVAGIELKEIPDSARLLDISVVGGTDLLRMALGSLEIKELEQKFGALELPANISADLVDIKANIKAAGHIVGVPKELKPNAERVGLTPLGVKALTTLGVKVIVEKGAGRQHFSDNAYLAAGAELVDTAEAVWTKATIIKKVKEPLVLREEGTDKIISDEFKYLRPGLIVFTYLHLASPELEDLAEVLLKKEVTGIAYETIQIRRNGKKVTPCLEPMSIIAGDLGGYFGVRYREYANLLGPLGEQKLEIAKEDVRKITASIKEQYEKDGKVSDMEGMGRDMKAVILGGGVSGFQMALRILECGGEVTVTDTNNSRLDELRDIFMDRGFQGKFHLINPGPDINNPSADVRDELMKRYKEADILGGCILIPGAVAPKMSLEMVKEISIEKKKVIIDIALDQGGNFAGSESKSYSEPVFNDEFGNLRFCVPNMPDAVGCRASITLEKTNFVYNILLAAGLEKALKSAPELKGGINTYKGKIRYSGVAKAYPGMPHTKPQLVVKDTTDQAVYETARRIVEAVKNAPRDHPFVLGLATGGTMISVYEQVINMTREQNVDWSNVVTFNLDEYLGIDKGHKESYRSYMNRNLFDALKPYGLEKSNTHIFDTIPNMPKEQFNRVADNEIKRFVSMIRKYGGVDLWLLGIGRDGHFAFLEPGENVPAVPDKVDGGVIKKIRDFNEFVLSKDNENYTFGEVLSEFRSVLNHKKTYMVTSGLGNFDDLVDARIQTSEAYRKSLPDSETIAPITKETAVEELQALGRKLWNEAEITFYVPDKWSDEDIKKLNAKLIKDNGNVKVLRKSMFFGKPAKVVSIAIPTIIDNSRFFSKLEEVPIKALTAAGIVLESAEVLQLITGSNKSGALGALFKKETDSVTLTSAAITKRHLNYTVIADKEAASAVSEIDQREFWYDKNEGVRSRVSKLMPNTYAIETDTLGNISLGTPPEVIKLYMKLGKSVPSVYVLPKNAFINGVNYADIEFPVYFNFFVNKGKKTTVVCTKEQKERAKAVFQETLFGPTVDDLVKAGMPLEEAKRYRKEMEFFHVRENYRKDGRILGLDDFVSFKTFDDAGSAAVGDVNITLSGDKLLVTEKGENIARLDNIVEEENVTPEPMTFPSKPFSMPGFGCTFLGTSTGFDKSGLTTSFITWWGGKGMLVDPLAFEGYHLKKTGIVSDDVEDVFLTHTHGDHDAGLIEKILQGHKVNLITSRVIYESFLRKAKAITGQDFSGKVTFKEAVPGIPMNWRGARLDFSYGLHSIPCLRFKITYQGKSIGYSGDTRFKPGLFDELEKSGIITVERKIELTEFSFDADKSIHEVGGAPLHTEPQDLANLPEWIRERMLVVHVPKVAPEAGLRKAEDGETLELLPMSDLLTVADRSYLAVRTVSLFEEMDDREVMILTRKFEPASYKKDDVIVRQGDAGDKFFVITRGEAKVLRRELDGSVKEIAVLGKGDFFGEMALINGTGQREASVQATTDTDVLVLTKEEFDGVINGGGAEMIKKIVQYRETLLKVPFFKSLPPREIIKICTKLRSVTFEKKTGQDLVIKKGEPGDSFFMIKSGNVVIEDETGEEIAKLGEGQFFGEIALIKHMTRTATVRVKSDKLEVLVLTREAFADILERYPFMAFNLERIAEERLRESAAREGRRQVGRAPRFEPGKSPSDALKVLLLSGLGEQDQFTVQEYLAAYENVMKNYPELGFTPIAETTAREDLYYGLNSLENQEILYEIFYKGRYLFHPTVTYREKIKDINNDIIIAYQRVAMGIDLAWYKKNFPDITQSIADIDALIDIQRSLLKGTAGTEDTEQLAPSHFKRFFASVKAISDRIKPTAEKDIKSAMPLAEKAGIVIRSDRKNRPLILLPSNFYKKAEFEAQEKEFAEKFFMGDVSFASGKTSPEQFITKVLSKIDSIQSGKKVAGLGERAIVLLPNIFANPENARHLETLTSKGIRFIISNENDFAAAKRMDVAERANAQRDTYVTMLLARALNEKDIANKSTLYQLFEFYIRSMYSLKGNVSAADYIKAIVGVGMSMPDRLSAFVNALL
ncbi:MAG: cyclic nucleotide-binding domain-containing protein, partial [Candidatus Omnitrophica bacterium]|nr:cyclic nucleotide-binding domain-containing protein [Candidatus Omnitrophota bacterium]